MNMDQENRNCYNCRVFGHLARNCRNRGTGNRMGKEKRLKYGQRRMIERENKDNNNLNGNQDLILLD